MNRNATLYEEINAFRGKDVYPNYDFKKEMIERFFPENICALTQDLSSVTAAFYGFLLLKIGELAGNDKINFISEQLFYELGKLKTIQAAQKMENIPRDTRAFAIIAVSAIYNASPEYQFSIEKFTSDHTILILKGEDRYHKIASLLGISDHLRWPTLKPFMLAIRDELKLHSEINITLDLLNESSQTICKYEFKNNEYGK